MGTLINGLINGYVGSKNPTYRGYNCIYKALGAHLVSCLTMLLTYHQWAKGKKGTHLPNQILWRGEVR